MIIRQRGKSQSREQHLYKQSCGCSKQSEKRTKKPFKKAITNSWNKYRSSEKHTAWKKPLKFMSSHLFIYSTPEKISHKKNYKKHYRKEATQWRRLQNRYFIKEK